MPGQHLIVVTWHVVCSQCMAVGEGFERFGFWENPVRQIKPHFSHKKANESNQKPSPDKLRGERQLLQGSQQVIPYPEQAISSSADTGLIGPKPENKVGIPWRRVQIMEAAASYLWLVLAGTTPQVSISWQGCPPLLAHLPAFSSWAVSSSEERLQASLSSSADRKR